MGEPKETGEVVTSAEIKVTGHEFDACRTMADVIAVTDQYVDTSVYYELVSKRDISHVNRAELLAEIREKPDDPVLREEILADVLRGSLTDARMCAGAVTRRRLPIHQVIQVANRLWAEELYNLYGQSELPEVDFDEKFDQYITYRVVIPKLKKLSRDVFMNPDEMIIFTAAIESAEDGKLEVSPERLAFLEENKHIIFPIQNEEDLARAIEIQRQGLPDEVRAEIQHNIIAYNRRLLKKITERQRKFAGLALNGYQDNRARCATEPKNAFFIDALNSKKKRLEAEAAAKAKCNQCLVREDCLEFALSRNERFGIWGGHTTEERDKIAAKRLSKRK